ncbi:MAG: hypothetical protein ACRDKU_08690, partial [Gaiellaceae bacterium]
MTGRYARRQPARTLKIPPEIRAQLAQHAREEAPNEACGLLVLQDGKALRYERGRNAEPSPFR